ncbi:hypothetical protein U1Q18_029870 [Sarracenia purpurea var. burkii]
MNLMASSSVNLAKQIAVPECIVPIFYHLPNRLISSPHSASSNRFACALHLYRKTPIGQPSVNPKLSQCCLVLPCLA